MKRFLEKKYVNTGFVIALVILLSINVLTYLNTSWHFQDEKYQTLALQTIQSSEGLFGRLTQAETSRRGYLITNSPEFVIEYYTAIKEIDSSYEKLKDLTLDDPYEIQIMDTLTPLIHDRKDLLQESIELQEGNKSPGDNMKGEIEFTERGKEKQDKIRTLLGLIQNRENEVLKTRYAQADSSSEYTLTNLVVGTSIAFILLILSITLLNKNITERKSFEKDLEESRNWLYTTLTSIGDAVIVTDKLGEVLFMNQTAKRITGWDTEISGTSYIDHVFSIVDEATGEKLESPVIQSLKSSRVVIVERNAVLISKDGSEFPIDYSAAPIKDNNLLIIGIVLVFRDVSSKRKIEKEIKSSQLFVQRIAESIPNILYIYELSGPEIVYANNKVSEVLGYDIDEIRKEGSSFLTRCIHPDDFKKLKSLYQRFATAGDNDVFDYEYRIRNSHGEWRWMHSYDVVFKRTYEGLASQMLGTTLDVTERKKLEDELKKYSGHLEELVDIRTKELKLTNEKLKSEISERARAEKNIIEAEEKFRSLVEHSVAGIFIVQQNSFAYVNPRYEEIFGYCKGELNGRSQLDLVIDEDKEIVGESFNDLFENRSISVQYNHRANRKDGTLIVLEVGATKIDYMGNPAIIGTLQDITNRKRAEDELRTQREFLRTVIDLSPNLIFAKDRDGKFTLANKAVAEIYGTTTEDLVGKTDADFNPNVEEVNHFLDADREVIDGLQEVVVPEERVFNSKTRESRWYQTIKIPLLSGRGERQVLGVSSDITSRKLAEELMNRNLREKEMLLKEIHHRVKNNLQIIVSLLKLQSRYIFDQRDLEIFNNSKARVETMSLIHEKLYKSKDISHINFESYVTELSSYLLKSLKIHPEDIEITVAANDVYLGIDTAIPCGLIINELLINTLKYAFPHGKKGKIEISVQKDEEQIILIVSDNGVGLTPEFNIASSESLGLQLVDTLMRQLAGTVHIENSSGTKFVFRLKEVKYKERI